MDKKINEEQEEPAKEKKKTRKRTALQGSKKEKENPVAKAIRLAVETGQISFGFNSSLRNIKNGTPKLIVVSKNIPEVHLSKVNSFAKNSKIMVYTF
ncbi:MAG: ribosomal L7Ae/L30e/S12e/Gadd45 family protein, partial [Candidatus ainarchaeum sp.]|nr:ribosomal L7Ae/L30e/S12e/Gadd45 family protein [Candidatus ainarchaeum sp.]